MLFHINATNFSDIKIPRSKERTWDLLLIIYS